MYQTFHKWSWIILSDYNRYVIMSPLTLPFEIVNIIIMKVASNKGAVFSKHHHQIRYPAMVRCLNTIHHDTLWLTDTTVNGNPFALDYNIDYVAAERLPPLI